MIQMNNTKSRKFFFNHVFGVFFIERDSDKLLFKLNIKEWFKMSLRVIFAIVLIGLSVYLIATQGLYQVFFIFAKIELIMSIKIYPCFKSATMKTSDRYKGSANGTSYARTRGLWRRDTQHMAHANEKCLTR